MCRNAASVDISFHLLVHVLSLVPGIVLESCSPMVYR